MPRWVHYGWFVGLALCGLAPLTVVAQEGAGQAALQDLLNRRGLALKGQVAALDRQIADISTRIPDLEREIDRLSVEAAAIDDTEEDENEPDDKPPARKVRFRPPLLREVELATPIVLVCINRRVAVLDLDESNAALEVIVKDPAKIQAFVDAGGGNLPAGDFELKVSLVTIGQSVLVNQEAVLKADRTGESLDEALQSDSRLGRRLQQIEPGKAVIQFAVYPDSFQEFRAARELLWREKFDINWLPREHGATITVGAGNASAQ